MAIEKRDVPSESGNVDTYADPRHTIPVVMSVTLREHVETITVWRPTSVPLHKTGVVRQATWPCVHREVVPVLAPRRPPRVVRSPAAGHVCSGHG